MKEKFFFSHDLDARNDPKIVDLMREHGLAGVGAFWCIVEQLHQSPDGRIPLDQCASIAFALHVDCKFIASVIQEFNLFKNDGTFFWSESVDKRREKRVSISEKRKNAANARWNNANALQKQCTSNAMINDKCINNNNINSSNEECDVVEKGKTAKRFVPPTLEEVEKFIQENHYTVDATRFVDFYESKGWFVGKNKMKDWKAAVRGWNARDKGESPRRQSKSNMPIKNVNDEWQ